MMRGWTYCGCFMSGHGGDLFTRGFPWTTMLNRLAVMIERGYLPPVDLRVVYLVWAIVDEEVVKL